MTDTGSIIVTYEQQEANWTIMNAKRQKKGLEPVEWKHEMCSVCREAAVAPGVQTPCHHAVCDDCLRNMTDLRCPLCRESIETGLPHDILSVIKARMLQQEETQNNKDFVIAQYLTTYPNVSLADVYTVVQLLEDPELLLYLLPHQLPNVIRGLSDDTPDDEDDDEEED